MAIRHCLSLLDFSPEELRGLIRRASELKRAHKAGERYEPLRNRVLGMVFEKASTRTRVSFEAAMVHFGGHALFLSPRDTQLGRGEPIEDTARVLSRMVDGVMMRTFSHETVRRFAEHASVPVINGLTDLYHPCQLLADVQTYCEHRGDIAGRRVTWIGDGNNVCRSYVNAALQFDFELIIACPPGYGPESEDPAFRIPERARVRVVEDPMEAAADADLVVTDVWASMGQEDEQKERAATFAPYQVTPELMTRAKRDALFMHCLPAHRGEEVAAAVIDGPASVVWDEAENRLHAQKALLEFLMAEPGAA